MATASIPNRPSGSAVRSIAQITANFDSILTFLNGQNLDPNNFSESLVNDKLGLSDADTIRRGKSIIATSEARTNTAYATLTTPDQVQNVVLPTDGLIFVLYEATWQESANNAARAALFIGANQIKTRAQNLSLGVQEACTGGSAGGQDTELGTVAGVGLASIGVAGAGGVGTDVTTGMVVGAAAATGGVPTNYITGGAAFSPTAMPVGSIVPIFAAAGTYTVSVQFKATSGSVTVKNRKLYVWTKTF